MYREGRETEDSIVKDLIFSVKLNLVISSPKIYGIFDHGRLEEYIDAKSLKRNDFSKPEIRQMFAKEVAKFHALDMPFVKNPSWFYKIFTGYLNIYCVTF